MKVLCFGDSNTYGYDPRSYFGSRYDSPWPRILADLSGWDVDNQGENGREIPKVPEQFPEDTDLLIVMLGTNDLLQFWTPDAAAEKMRRFLESVPLRRANILLLSPPTMSFGTWVLDQELIEDSVALARLYQNLADELGIQYASTGEWNIPMAYDGVHMTEDGHRIFAEKLFAFISSNCTPKFLIMSNATGG